MSTYFISNNLGTSTPTNTTNSTSSLASAKNGKLNNLKVFYFFKNGPFSASFCLLSSFSHHNSNINWKSEDVVFGDRTQGRRMVDVDGSTELWRHTSYLHFATTTKHSQLFLLVRHQTECTCCLLERVWNPQTQPLIRYLIPTQEGTKFQCLFMVFNDAGIFQLEINYFCRR